MKRDLLPVTVLAGGVLLTVMPADAAAQRRGRPARGGGRSVVVRPAYGPYYYRGFYDAFFSGYPGWYPYLLGDDLRGIRGSIAVQIGGR